METQKLLVDKLESQLEDGGDYTLLEGKQTEENSNQTAFIPDEASSKTPWFIWPLLLFALIMSSTSGPLTKELELQNASPISMAGWRFQVTALVLLPCFLWQLAFMTSQARLKLYHNPHFGHIFLSAIGLTAAFGLLNWSVDHTALTNSLFLSVTCPLYVAMGTLVTGGKITRGEISGVVLGIVGSLILTAGTEVDPADPEEDTLEGSMKLLGDAAAFLSAGGFALYLTTSRQCRASMPVYIYMFPSTVLVALMLGIAGVALEGWGSVVQGAPDAVNGPFGWFSNAEFLLSTLFLGIVPGFLCFNAYNIVLAFTTSLVVSMGLAICPVTGSLLGWLMGLAAIPNVYTVVGGGLTMAAVIVVNLATLTSRCKEEIIDVQSTITKGDEGVEKVSLLQDHQQP